MVESVATTIASRGKLPPGITLEDLKSWGIEGLIKARGYYDPTKGTQFKTYAFYRIRGEMLDKIRREWAYRNPSGYRQRQEKIQQRISDLVQADLNENDNPGTNEEAQKKAYDLIANSAVVYLVSVENVEQMSTLEHSEDPTEQLLEDIDSTQDHLLLLKEVRNLTELEMKIVELFYFKDLKQKDIAEKLNLSKSKVCRMHMKILDKLRRRLESRIQGGK